MDTAVHPGLTERLRLFRDPFNDRYDNQAGHVKNAIEEEKQEGLRLAVRARWFALAIISVLVVYINPNIEVVYYHFLIGLFALIGWAQLRVGRAGQSRAELILLMCDIVLMTITQIAPNPLHHDAWPAAMQLRFEGFDYFYILLAAALLSYSWRTLMTMGTWVAVAWSLGLLWIWMQPPIFADFSAQLPSLLTADPNLAEWFDPDRFSIENQVHHVVVFLIVSFTLATAKQRWTRLLLRFADTSRERTNLSRYFSPNVVAELAQKDDPLKIVRTQNIAVLFVDIVGFTRFADRHPPEAVIDTLREFVRIMEEEVFHHHGTLDKYLGDGLMATFGTPSTGAHDATNAIRCAQSMIARTRSWNSQRIRDGLEPIKIVAGLHYGPAILGDIGENRLEFAVLGHTVNIASRLEALCREHRTSMIVSDDLLRQVDAESAIGEAAREGMTRIHAQKIRGVTDKLDAWKQT